MRNFKVYNVIDFSEGKEHQNAQTARKTFVQTKNMYRGIIDIASYQIIRVGIFKLIFEV